MLEVLDDLATAAADAATARKLEQLADDAQRSENLRDSLLARALNLVEKALGEEAGAVAEYEYEQWPRDEPDRVVVSIAGVKLEVRHNGSLYPLVTCPLCDAWAVLGRDAIRELADFGEIITHAARLHEHPTPDDEGRQCDGLRIVDTPPERPAWQVAVANTPEKLHEQLNMAHAEGYRPQVYQYTGGFVIIGKRIGDSRNAAYDAFDDDEPF